MDNITIILPSLDPDEKMPIVVRKLLEVGFNDIVVVNDGTAKEGVAPFEEVAQLDGCHLLTHEVNMGKGQALKTAFDFVLKNRPNCVGVVTVDGDGQHLTEDIYACSKALLENNDNVVLGVRDFDAPHVPWRSKFGNTVTVKIFEALCGMKVSDTQTGLRGIPTKILPSFLEVEGQRFEYETNMLLHIKREKIKIKEVKIQTVYLDENKTSHFNPIKDSIRIYGAIFRFALSSLSSSALDIGLFTVLNLVLSAGLSRSTRLLLATGIARVCSAIFNYTLNKKAVFKSKASVSSSGLKYFLLCIVQGSLSYGLVFALSYLFTANAFWETVIKLLVDSFLFFVSFKIQRDWVFIEKRKRGK